MPTIEVEDSDQVFVVKGRGAVRGGYHELGPNDLLVMTQMIPSEADPSQVFIPYTRVYIGGTRVTGIERFTLSINPSEIVFVFSGAWSDTHGVALVHRLDPFVTIQYSGVGSDPVRVESEPEPERYIGVRVSRYERKPVI